MINTGRKSKPHEDLTGKRFSGLVVKSMEKSVGRTPDVWMCVCQCDCGRYVTVRKSSLIQGKAVRCGHLCDVYKHKSGWKIKNSLPKLPINVVARHSIYASCKHGAKNRGINFDINESDFEKLISLPCRYCGNPHGNAAKYSRRGEHTVIMWNGLDRIDSSFGYSMDNVAPCCGSCNKAKQSMSESQFKEFITRIYEHFVLETG